MRPHEETISVGGLGVHTWIGGQGAPLLVLHGAGGNRGWTRWLDQVSERFTVWAPTHPGFGRSGDADWMDGIDDLARFHLWFIEAAGLGRPHLLGHSIGGWTAAEMATMSPGAIERLILVAPVGRNREMAARLTWKPYMHNPRLAHFLPRVTNRTLIVWGREDRIVPVECGEQYRRLLPAATLTVLERCGHLPPIEQPDRFARLVLDFLEGEPRR